MSLLDEDNDENILLGAVEFIDNLCSNRAQLPVMQFKHLFAKITPRFLPALQNIIYHPNY